MLKIQGTIATLTAQANTVKNRFILGTGAVAGDNARAVGVSTDDVDSGYALPVQLNGIGLIEVGTDVTAGGIVASDANGKAKPAGANPVNGIALETVVAGKLCRIKIV